MNTRVFSLFLIAVAFSPAAKAQLDQEQVAEHVVRVTAYDGNSVTAQASGLVVATDRIITNAWVVDDADRVTVISATNPAEILAEVDVVDDQRDLALLRARGLGKPPATLSNIEVNLGRIVFSANPWVRQSPTARAIRPQLFIQTPGTIGQINQLTTSEREPRPIGQILRHNAMVPVEGLGSPLLNECGEVVGLNRLDPGVSRRELSRGYRLQGTVSAVPSRDLMAFLRSRNVPIQRAEERCIPVAERNEQARAAAVQQAEMAASEAQLAQQRAADAEQRALALEQQASQSRQQSAEAQQQMEEARAAADAAQIEAAARAEEAAQRAQEVSDLQGRLDALQEEQAAAELEIQQAQEEAAAAAEQNRQRLIIIAASVGGVFVLALLAAFIMSKIRARRVREIEERAMAAEQDAANVKAQLQDLEADFPDCLLEGEDEHGARRAVKIPGRLIVSERGGVVLGRSAEYAACVLDHPEVSREHARFFMEGQDLAIEDLNSTNGTMVNNHSLAPQESVTLREGDMVQLGRLLLNVRFLR